MLKLDFLFLKFFKHDKTNMLELRSFTFFYKKIILYLYLKNLNDHFTTLILEYVL
ncbi:hypothetical protein CPARA_2gp240 (nucleomorph) [Cryptomonas paramecium]|uniref:Uncharacterized protein n=1 Tax=Cryptomonas paramaecium TaxID=2898 RepID=F2HHV2_9CRYP|nr:hypothetical protein CPARA_2gp240 [Cryptomonas paramecium]AEA38898.1 hypothetical protein CPARA_2gp240 [Cryptomonas paramecium]